MVEQLFFIILSIVLFVIIFFKLIQKNDTSYVPIIAIEALGIAIDFITLIANISLNIFVKAIIYLMSIILPIIIIVLEKKRHQYYAKNKNDKSKYIYSNRESKKSKRNTYKNRGKRK